MEYLSHLPRTVYTVEVTRLTYNNAAKVQCSSSPKLQQPCMRLAKETTIKGFYHTIRAFLEELGFTLFQISNTQGRSAPLAANCLSDAMVRYSRDQNQSLQVCGIVGSMDFYREYSVSVPAYLGNGTLVLSVLGEELASGDFYKQVYRHGDALHSLVDAINVMGGLKFPQFLFREYHTETINSLGRPLQALQWASLGCPHKEIAARMNISPKTVNDHLRSMRKSLGARNTSHAIRLAGKMQLFSLDD